MKRTKEFIADVLRRIALLEPQHQQRTSDLDNCVGNAIQMIIVLSLFFHSSIHLCYMIIAFTKHLSDAALVPSTFYCSVFFLSFYFCVKAAKKLTDWTSFVAAIEILIKIS